jgi:hypothetical protein
MREVDLAWFETVPRCTREDVMVVVPAFSPGQKPYPPAIGGKIIFRVFFKVRDKFDCAHRTPSIAEAVYRLNLQM